MKKLFDVCRWVILAGAGLCLVLAFVRPAETTAAYLLTAASALTHWGLLVSYKFTMDWLTKRNQPATL